MAVFRGKLLASIRQALARAELARRAANMLMRMGRQALARAELALPEGLRSQQLLNLLTRLGHPRKAKWNVRITERYRHGAGVVTYLARYLRGGPIKNARLVAFDGTRVTFQYRASASWTVSSSRLTLPVADFLHG
jgi:hypothetical protein